MKIGELLIARGLITEPQLVGALERQRQSSEKIGQCLVSEGALAEETLLRALSDQLDIPYVESIPEDAITRESLSLVSYDNAISLGIVVGRMNDQFVVFVNQDHELVLTMLRPVFSRMRLAFALARAEQIKNLQMKYLEYGADAS